MVGYFPEIEWFFGSIFIYLFAYLFVDYEYRSVEAYTILPNDRKNYFKKNIVKCFALLGISIYGTYIVANGFIFNKWDNQQIHRMGYLYSSLDFLGLLKVKNLPVNSKIHHATTFLLSYLNTWINYDNPSFWIGLPVYCILSCYACGVNFFLGMRLIKPLTSMRKLILFNLISYIFLLLLNWMYQIYNLKERVGWNYNWDSLLYVGLIIFVANDDIKLVKFLHHHLKNRKDWKRKDCQYQKIYKPFLITRSNGFSLQILLFGHKVQSKISRPIHVPSPYLSIHHWQY